MDTKHGIESSSEQVTSTNTVDPTSTPNAVDPDAGDGGSGKRRMNEAEAAESIMVVLYGNPKLRGMVKRRIELVDTEESKPPEPDGPQFSLDKTRDEFRPIARWLSNRTPQEKLAAVALHVLLHGDIERSLKEAECYDGDVGNDLAYDWRREIERVMDVEDLRAALSPEELMVASYVIGLHDAGSY